MLNDQDLTAYIHFFHEVGLLSDTPRSGFAFLGSGKQSVAEHSFRMALIAYALADLVPTEKIDRSKLLAMSLLHDLPEARIGDLNYVNKRYVEANEEKALEDIRSAYPCGSHIFDLLKEYREGKTIEAKLAHDADQLELMLALQKELELGNTFASTWLENASKRIQTPAGKALAQKIGSVLSHTWWSGLEVNFQNSP